MTDHTGPGAVEQMESHMGVTVDDMARETADADHDEDGHGGGQYEQGHC